MFTPENKTPRAGDAKGANEAVEATNLSSESKSPASKRLFAEADRVIAAFPFVMTRQRKREAERSVLRIFLAALDAGRQEIAV